MRCILLSLFFVVMIGGTVPAEVTRDTWQRNETSIALLKEHRYTEALEILHGLERERALDPVIRKNLATAYLGAGQARIQAGANAAALEFLNKGKDYDDTDARFWLLSGIALLKGGQADAAERELNEAWAMSGDEPHVLQYLGQLYYDTDRMFEAVDTWQRALRFDPGNQTLQNLLAKAERELAVEKELERNYSGHFILSYAENDRVDIGGEILDTLEEAYTWASAKLGHYPERQTPVILYTQRQFSGLTGSPEWASGLYDGKIRLSIGGITRIDAPVRALFFHEFMHVMVRDMAGPRVPTWLNEGLAEIAAREEHDPPTNFLNAAIGSNTILPLSQLAPSFRGLAADRVGLAYEQSYSFVHYLLDRFGWFEMSQLLTYLKQGADIESAMRMVYGDYGADLETLELDWRRQL